MGRYTNQFLVMRRIVTTNQSHRIVCTQYMRAPAIGNNAVRSAVHAAQPHIVNDTMILSWNARSCVHTAQCVCTISDLGTSLTTTGLSRVYQALVSKS